MVSRNAKPVDPMNNDGSPLRVSLFADADITTLGLDFERQALSEGFRYIAGLDEVGRGCIAGPVVAAACILDIEKPYPAKLNDSKKLTAKVRENIATELKETAIGYAFGIVEAEEIDRINILEATKLAMLQALAQLDPKADYLLIDALHLKGVEQPQKAIIKGDSISASIAAASVLAKTFRDELMTHYHETFPQYGFASHKGYGSAAHYAALKQHGHSPLHRISFKGVVQTD